MYSNDKLFVAQVLARYNQSRLFCMDTTTHLHAHTVVIKAPCLLLQGYDQAHALWALPFSFRSCSQMAWLIGIEARPVKGTAVLYLSNKRRLPYEDFLSVTGHPFSFDLFFGSRMSGYMHNERVLPIRASSMPIFHKLYPKLGLPLNF